MKSNLSNGLSHAYNVRTGTIEVQGEDVLIAREADFKDFIHEATAEKVFSLKSALEKAVRAYGELRSPAVDLLRMRIRQVREVLAA